MCPPGKLIRWILSHSMKVLRMKKIRILALGATIATSLHADMANTAIKIGYIEMNKAIGSSKEGQAIQKKVMSKHQELQQELSVKAQALMKKQAALEQKIKEGLVDQNKLREEQMALESEARIYKEEEARAGQRFELWQQEMQQKEMGPFMEGMQKAVEATAKAEKLSFVVVRETGAIVYADPQFDITVKVVSDIDAAYSKKQGKGAAPAAKPAAKAPTAAPQHHTTAVVKNGQAKEIVER